jgi:hypothetical protein
MLDEGNPPYKNADHHDEKQLKAKEESEPASQRGHFFLKGVLIIGSGWGWSDHGFSGGLGSRRVRGSERRAPGFVHPVGSAAE